MALSRTYLGENWVLGKVGGRWVILYMSNSKTRLWLVFTLFSLFLLAEHFVQFGMPIGLKFENGYIYIGQGMVSVTWKSFPDREGST